jgi:hypothetical protein
MFAENIIQAGLEQVKTTRGSTENNFHIENYFSYFVDYYNVTTTINGTTTTVTKLKFITRYVAGSNFLGSNYFSFFSD